jgi:thiamine kinase-like enzyme
MSLYYYTDELGEVQGPYEWEHIEAWIQDGSIPSSTFIQDHQQTMEWTPYLDIVDKQQNINNKELKSLREGGITTENTIKQSQDESFEELGEEERKENEQFDKMKKRLGRKEFLLAKKRDNNERRIRNISNREEKALKQKTKQARRIALRYKLAEERKTRLTSISVSSAKDIYGIDFNSLIPYFLHNFHYVTNVAKIDQGKQNKNFMLTTNTSKKYMCRIPGVHNLTYHGQQSQIVFKNSEIAAKVYKVAPLTLYFDPPSFEPHPTSNCLKGRKGTGIILTEYVTNGKSLTLEDFHDNEMLIDQVMAIVRKYHKISLIEDTSLDVIVGETVEIVENVEKGKATKDHIDAKNCLHSSAACNVLWGYDLEDASEGWKSFTPTIFQRAQQVQMLLHHATRLYGHPLVACHNDLSPSNILRIPIKKVQASEKGSLNVEEEENMEKGNLTVPLPTKVKGDSDKSRDIDDDADNNANNIESNDKIELDNHFLIVDWEWSGPGDGFYDIATFINSTNQDVAGEMKVLSSYLERKPTSLEIARVSLMRIWVSIRRALFYRNSALACMESRNVLGQKEKGLKAKYDYYIDSAEEQLNQFTMLFEREIVQGTEFETGLLEQLTVEVDTLLRKEEKERTDKEFQERKRLRQIERERLLLEGSDTDSD